MKMNDIKKGMRIKLRNDWYGTMYDNLKGNVRMVQVEGYDTEIGSVYSHDIILVKVNETNDTWIKVEHTPKQIERRNSISAGGW